MKNLKTYWSDNIPQYVLDDCAEIEAFTKTRRLRRRGVGAVRTRRHGATGNGFVRREHEASGGVFWVKHETQK